MARVSVRRLTPFLPAFALLASIAIFTASGCEGAIGTAGGDGGPDGSDGDGDGGRPDASVAVARLAVDQASHEFGDALLGAVSNPVTITVQNLGSGESGPITIGLTGAAPAQFSIDGDGCSNATLATLETCTVVLTFRPTVAGGSSAAFDLQGTPGGAASVELEGRGLSAGALTITPTSHDYGVATLGTSAADRSFTVFNSGGSATGTLATTLGGSDATEYTLVSDGCDGMSLAVLGSCQVVVGFDPISSGAKAATLSVVGTPGGAAIASLSGDGQTPATLSALPTSHDFGSLTLGQQSAIFDVTVTNAGGQGTGTLTVGVSGAVAQFPVVSNGCQGVALEGAASCVIRVRYSAQAVGPVGATITISGTPGGSAQTQLSGRGLTPAALTMSPGMRNFGTVVVGASSAQQAFTVSNTGLSPSGSLVATVSGAQASDFALVADGCSGEVLGGGDTCQVILALAPATSGSKSATLVVTGVPGGAPSAQLSGNAQSPALLALTPPAHSFGSVTQGQQSASFTFTLTNSGQATSGTITTTLTGAGASQFAILTNNCTGVALAGGATCTIITRFRPLTSGVKNATLGAGASPGGGDTSALTGTGLTPAQLAITPASQTFGAVTQGQQSGSFPFTVTNNGQSPSGNVAVTLGGGADAAHFVLQPGGTCGGSLAAGASCSVALRFLPTSAGAKTASLIAAATPGGSVSSTLSGTGLSLAQLVITPAAQPFGGITVGQQSSNFGFTVSNSGQTASGALTVGVSGAQANDFKIFSSTCGAALAGGANCQVVLFFQPAAAGSRSATLSATATPGGSDTTALTGTGLTPASLSITPPGRDYGDVIVGESGSFGFTVTNGGQSPSGAIAVALTGAAAYDVTLDTCTGAVLVAGGTCVIAVAFTPGAPGVAGASLAIAASPGGADASTLTGTGHASAQLVITPGAHDFGLVLGGTSSAPFQLTVENVGDATSGTLVGGLSGADAGMFEIVADTCKGIELLGGESCTVDVVFHSPLLGLSTFSAELTVDPAPGAGGAVSATLEGQGL